MISVPSRELLRDTNTSCVPSRGYVPREALGPTPQCCLLLPMACSIEQRYEGGMRKWRGKYWDRERRFTVFSQLNSSLIHARSEESLPRMFTVIPNSNAMLNSTCA